MAIIPLSNFLKNLPKTQGQKKPFDLGLPTQKKSLDLGLPEIGGMKTTTTPMIKKANIIPLRETLKHLKPEVVGEAGEKVFKGIWQFGKSVGQGIARSFVGTAAGLLGKGEGTFRPDWTASYIPQSNIEKKIFGTDKPISIKSIGEEVLAIGGEDFKQKWGRYAVPVGLLVASLDITPIGWGKKDVAKGAAKIIAKTENIPQIAKVLKGVLKGTDEEIQFLAKSLSKVNKEDDVLRIVNSALKAPAVPVKPSAIPKELEPLATEARKYKSAEEFVNSQINAYHGTGKAFDSFDATKRTIQQGESSKVGFFFNKDPKEAQVFAREAAFTQKIGTKGEVMPVKLEYKNPKYLPEGQSTAKIERVLQAKKEGFDAVIDDRGNIVVFDKSQIKTKSQLTDFYNQAVKGVEEVAEEVPKITPENTIQKLIKALDEAVPLNVEQKKLYSQEMAKRTARVAAMGEKVAGEKGFFAQLGQLKGELPKKQFEAIRKQFTQKEADLLFSTIEQTKTLLPLEKVATKGGLAKLLNGAVPTKSEIELLRQTFPKELVDAILARRPLLERMAELGIELSNVPRTMMATTDLSFGFRQGVFMLGRPKQFFPSFKDQFKFFASEKAYQGLIEGIKARPTYLKMKQAGLALTEIGGQITKREEVFMGNLAERIPLYGRMVRASNRAYTGFANKLRADLFDDLLSKAKIAGKDITDDNFLKSLADFINSGTGRGKFGLKETGILPKGMEKIAPILNAAFFSPRLMASRLNMLNPYFYIQMDPFVRKEAMKTLFADAGIFATIYGLWKLNGGDVGLDPRSADFGKIKIGNTRYDVLGGFQQYIRLAAQLITGEIVSSTTGRTITLGEGYKPLTRQEILLRFFENKTSPIASFIIGLLKGQTATGEDVDVPTEIINRFIPMVIQDIYDVSQEKGAEGILMGLPAIFGVGMQTYGKQELAFGESKLGEPTAQIRPVPELAEKIRELVMGQLPLGVSKSYSVEAYFDQLSNLPRGEAANIFDKINEANPDLAKKISDVVKEREKGITVKDKDLKSKGVASGDRALAIKKELDKLKTKEEKAQLWEEYVRKGVITKDVATQLTKLLNQ